MRIGVVSQWYPPEPAFIPGSLATELTARGHEVRVLTGYPNYPQGTVYPGYRQSWRHRHTDGRLSVRRVPLYPSHDASAARRAATFVSFAASSVLAAPRYLADIDVLYVYLPPGTAYAAAAVLRLLRRVPVVLHVQDVWPESVTASPLCPGGLTGRVADAALARLMRAVYRSADRVVVIAPGARDLVAARGADRRRVQVVLNWTDERLFRPVPATSRARDQVRAGGRSRCTIMYAGNLGVFQGVDEAVRAAAAMAGKVDLVLVGSGVAAHSARSLAEELGAGNVRFLGQRPPEEMAELAAAADYQLVTLRDLPVLRGVIPSKLQAALACGVPVIAAAAGDTARFVRRTGVGWSCPPGDWRAIADAFSAAAAAGDTERARLAVRARRTYELEMSLAGGVDRIEQLLLEAAHRRAVAR
ncbi:glycosyltransferase family 4 protein [Solwaraspora sp. WMMB335]|uniref:glycosyltransferase family 4 protein n=1 Tax=Solwaraspora sp. WMMB335 TaxID=3404118 RepID=UPI003B9275F6